MDRFLYKPTKSKLAKSVRKKIEKMELIKNPNPFNVKSFKGECLVKHKSGEDVLVCDNLKVGYSNKNILADVSFKLYRGQKLGIIGPNGTGKSTFINALAGKACAKTGNKPGVTKGKQWIRLNKNVELLDTPGILWPKFEDQTVGLRLAFIGSIKDEILNTEELAAEMIQFMKKHYPGVLAEKYSMEEVEDQYVCLGKIAESRHCLLKGNELDYSKAAILLIDDFRNGKLGRITLEFPEDYME